MRKIFFPPKTQLIHRRAKLLERRLHEVHILIQNLLQIPPPLVNVARHATCESRVRVRVDEQLHMEQFPHLGEVKHQDSLEEHHIRRIDGERLVFPPATIHASCETGCLSRGIPKKLTASDAYNRMWEFSQFALQVYRPMSPSSVAH